MKDPYKMIQSCQEKNEPFFVLRAQDRFALKAVMEYAGWMYSDMSIPQKFKDEMDEILVAFRNWSKNEKLKTPD